MQEADLSSVILGLLINLAEASRSCCHRLLQVRWQGPGQLCRTESRANQGPCLPRSIQAQQAAASSDNADEALLPLLCQLTQVSHGIQRASP